MNFSTHISHWSMTKFPIRETILLLGNSSFQNQSSLVQDSIQNITSLTKCMNGPPTVWFCNMWTNLNGGSWKCSCIWSIHTGNVTHSNHSSCCDLRESKPLWRLSLHPGILFASLAWQNSVAVPISNKYPKLPAHECFQFQVEISCKQSLNSWDRYHFWKEQNVLDL